MKFTKKLILLSLITITQPAFASEKPARLFVMLDVDNTITDRIDPNNKLLEQTLLKKNYSIKKINFTVYRDDTSDPQAFGMYYERLKRFKIKGDPQANLLNIQESIIIRPNIAWFLESIIHISDKKNIDTHILICSRKDLTRSKTLINAMDFKVLGHVFKDMVEVLPRNNFRVATKTNGKKIVSKSAKLLREKYHGKFAPISQDDYVILIDQLEDDRFIAGNSSRDLNLPIPAFEVKGDFNAKEDNEVLNKALAKLTMHFK